MTRRRRFSVTIDRPGATCSRCGSDLPIGSMALMCDDAAGRWRPRCARCRPPEQIDTASGGITSRYRGVCAVCGEHYAAGAPIRARRREWAHAACADVADRLEATR